MVDINIQSIIAMLAQSVGIEGTEKIVNEAIQEAGLERKAFFTKNEFAKICENLKKRGGFIKIFAALAMTSEYREMQYLRIIEKERKEKEDLTYTNTAMELLNSELKSTNDKLHQANEALKTMQEELVRTEKLATIGLLAASVGHELRNPLGSIKNVCYFLQKKITAGDQKVIEMLNLLYREVEQANKIINDLLNFSRVMKIRKTEVSVEKLLDESIKDQGEKDNVKIVKNYSGDLNKFMADGDRLKLVFQNIISNAYQSMPSGGTLTVTTAMSRQGPEAEPQSWAEIIFNDTGHGMNPETAKHVFEPLFTTKIKGIGLGMAIAKEIVERHDGKISLDSVQDKGTTVSVLIPMGKDQK